MPEKIAHLEQQIEQLQGIVYQLIRGDRYLFQRDLDIFDKNIVLHSTLGTRIGTASTQKLAFWGATPVVRQTANTAPSGGGSSDSDAVDVSARTAIGQIRTALINIGLVA